MLNFIYIFIVEKRLEINVTFKSGYLMKWTNNFFLFLVFDWTCLNTYYGMRISFTLKCLQSDPNKRSTLERQSSKLEVVGSNPAVGNNF